jgi:hypothetical protein
MGPSKTGVFTETIRFSLRNPNLIVMKKVKNYHINVFVNCPFDDEYFDLLRPLLFTILYFKHQPRISLESFDSGEFRLQKIVSLIRESKYSIHDLSRLQAKNANEFYRLNMPFELGIDYGFRVCNTLLNDKRSLILEKEKYDYMKAISDISGFDIKAHNNNPEKLIECLRQWFSETAGLRDLKGSARIYSDFIDFNTNLFRKKIKKYFPKNNTTEAEKYAKAEIEEMSIAEFISEIKTYLSDIA